MTTLLDLAVLDDPAALASADSRGTLLALASAGAHVREAATLAREAKVEAVGEDGRPRAVVVGALGGSAAVGDLLMALAGPGAPVPVQAVRTDTLPGWAGPVDLVVAVSLSGRAAGPLAVAAEAARRGCRLLTVGSADSPLAEVTARARGVHVPTPHSVRSSRVGIWALSVPVLMAAHELALVDLPSGALEETAAILDDVAERARPASDSFVNPAKSLAVDLAGSVPLVLGEGPFAGAAAARAAAELARSAGTRPVTARCPTTPRRWSPPSTDRSREATTTCSRTPLWTSAPRRVRRCACCCCETIRRARRLGR